MIDTINRRKAEEERRRTRERLRCCNSEKVADGKQELMRRFAREKQKYDEEGITDQQRRLPAEGGDGRFSCYATNAPLLDNLARNDEAELGARFTKQLSDKEREELAATRGLPPCWDCRLENRCVRDRVRIPMAGGFWGYETVSVLRDHWVVICAGKDREGQVIDRASFDLWLQDAVPGQHPNAKGGFRDAYPVYLGSEWPDIPKQSCRN